MMSSASPKEERVKFLISRAKALEEEGQLQDAVTTAKEAFQIEKSAETSDLMKNLIQKVEELNFQSIDSLLTEFLVGKNAESGLKLAAMSSNVAAAVQIIPKFRLLFSHLNQDNASTCIRIILNIGDNCQSYFKDLIAAFVDVLPMVSKDVRVIDIITTVLARYAVSPSFAFENISPLLDLIYDSCKGATNDQKIYANIVKVLANEQIALDFINNHLEILSIVMESALESHRAIAVGISSRIFAHLSDKDTAVVDNAIKKAIIDRFVSVDTVPGLLALTTVLQAKQPLGIQILSSEGLLEQILEAIEFEKDEVKLATVDLFSAACSTLEVRKLIASKASSFLISCSRKSKNSKLQLSAFVVMVKIMNLEPTVQSEVMTNNDSVGFISKLLQSEEPSPALEALALECLSYLSLQSRFKEQIANNSLLLKKIGSIGIRKNDAATQYAFLVTCLNIARFPKELTEEEKQAKKLQKVAQGLPETDPLEEREAVKNRIELLVKENFIPLFGKITITSINGLNTISELFLSFADDQKYRGSLVQVGACKLLIKAANACPEEFALQAAQALAKIAITTDPHLAFKGELAAEAIRPLVLLLKEGGLLAQFESMMALTNLAGTDDGIREKIFGLGAISLVRELQFSSNRLVRRAATELLCNMVYHPLVYAMYLEENSQLLKIMVALCGEDDLPTKRAASGVVAIISSQPDALAALKKLPKFAEVVLELLQSDIPEIAHRGIETAKNYKHIGGPLPRNIDLQCGNLKNHPNATISSIAKMI